MKAFPGLGSLAERLRTDDMARDSFIMVVSGLLTGLFTYLYQLAMGILLPDPAQYGTLLSLTSLLVIFAVFTQSVTITVALFTSRLRVEARLGAVNYLWRLTMRRTLLTGLLFFVVLAGISPLLSSFLNIGNTFYPVILFASVIVAFAFSACTGVLQGLQRFPALATSQVVWALLRPVFGVIFVCAGLGVSGGLAAFPLSYVVAFALAVFFLRGLTGTGSEKVETRGLGSYASLAFVAMFSVAMLTNVDVVLAKHYLDDIAAGNYAAISVLGRIAFYAPMGIAAAMFPKTSESFASGGAHHRLFLKALLQCLAILGAICFVYALFADPIVEFLFSDKYPDVPPYLLRYGLSMSLLSLSYVVMTYLFSLAKTKAAYPLLAAMILQVTLITIFHSSIGDLVNVMLVCATVSLLLLVLFCKATWDGIDKRPGRSET